MSLSERMAVVYTLPMPIVAVFTVLLLTLLSACPRPVTGGEGEGEGNDRTPGSAGGPCLVGDLCTGELVCAEGICVGIGPQPGEGEGEGGNEGEGEGGNCIDNDRDGDCVETDCDDNDRNRSSLVAEACSFVDENCDGNNNEGIDCRFLSHDRERFFMIDPFAETVTTVGSAALPGDGGLLDVDLDVDGTLVAARNDGLYAVEMDGTLTLQTDADAPTRTVGMAINSSGTRFLVNQDGEDSGAYQVSAAGVVTLVGNVEPYQPSGDCVVLKNDDLLMSARGLEFGDPDVLVAVNATTGAPTLIGSIGYERVYGLSASFDWLFGTTLNGEVLLIDPSTGAGDVLFIDAEREFWGAANAD
jgi:hypothetical protein